MGFEAFGFNQGMEGAKNIGPRGSLESVLNYGLRPTGKGGLGIPGTAYNNLAEILGSQGQLPPQLINKNLAAIDRGTQGVVEGIQQNQARTGMTSGLAQALGQSAQMGGVQMKSDYRASEDRAAQDRQRQDLMLFLQMVLGPNIDMAAIEAGLEAAKMRDDASKEGALIGGLSSALGGGVSLLTGGLGGLF